MDNLRTSRTSPRKSHSGRIGVLVVFAVAFIGLLLLRNQMFVVHSVSVEGNRRYTAEQVVTISGIRAGQNVFSLSEQEIADNIARDLYLVFDSMYINYPDHVILRVHERGPSAALSWLGVLVMLDERGVVMETTNMLDDWLQVPIVTGVNVTSSDVGLPLQSRDPKQIEALQKVLEELSLQGFLTNITELNVGDLEKLYLVTQEGMKVELGNLEKMEVKIGILRGVYAQLVQQQALTGTIDVSTGEYADHREQIILKKTFVPDPTVQPRATQTPRP